MSQIENQLESKMKNDISIKDKFVFWLIRFLKNHKKWMIGIAWGFLLGRVTNEMSVPHRDVIDVINGLFSVTDHPTNLLSWLSLLLLITIPTINRILIKLNKKRQYAKLFTFLVKQHKARVIAPYNALAWDSALSLQICPELHRGWLMSEVRLYHNTTKFSLPQKYTQAYKEYFKKYYKEKRFFDDGIKFMLTSNPIAFSDTPTLVLYTKETLYSQIMFFKDNVEIIPFERNELIKTCVKEGVISFPHSLAMATVVVTSDDKLLIVKRCHKVAYFPNTWSCSIDEQLAPQDMTGSANNIVLRWGKRMLLEELGLENEAYNDDNLRILSVFLESDIFEITLCVHVTLDIDSHVLDRVLHGLPRTDYEFDEWTFLDYKVALDELFTPTRLYDGTSGYRMLLASIHRFGEPVIAERFLNRR